MTQPPAKSASSAATLGVSAAVVDPSDHDAPAYGLFALEKLAEDGAFLAGSIFLEKGEEFTVELSAEGQESLRIRAKVVAHQRSPVLGMDVSFPGLSDEERKAVSVLIAATSG